MVGLTLEALLTRPNRLIAGQSEVSGGVLVIESEETHGFEIDGIQQENCSFVELCQSLFIPEPKSPASLNLAIRERCLPPLMSSYVPDSSGFSRLITLITLPKLPEGVEFII